ncbi:hypothetical protein [Microtetraspora sp. NBRC 16547]|uniref:hypothetical protein n=1 Tax=Microtetraspora sp. NBRC 16547 TaxID=3030993 RepID=UPI0024A1A4E3|nr:hypothetical protein [Microtetraspora sp. NBRC 16547]GLW97712.1 hypothetical protein Misp02_17990 [Microtetraspora sp. NBRC 16547]
MLRLHDTLRDSVVPVVPAGARALRMYISASPDPLAYLLPDLVRRVIERNGLRVLTHGDAHEPGAPLALNVHLSPPLPYAGEPVDLVLGPGGPDGRHRVVGGPLLFEGRAATATLVTDVEAAGLDPLAVRLAFLEHHYRGLVDLTWDLLRSADRTVRRWRGRVARWAESPSGPIAKEPAARVLEAFDDDLDTSRALRLVRELEIDESVAPGSRFETFLYLDHILGLDLSSDIGKLLA